MSRCGDTEEPESAINISSHNQENPCSTVSIHKNVLAFLNTKTTKSTDKDPKQQKLKRRLQDLQKHRIYLESEIATARSQAALVSHDFATTPEQSGIQLASNFISPTDLQEIRKKRKLTAAYRLGGITAAIPHMDPELLSLRFDICLDGVYVATYHAFFDLIVAQDDQLYLRLTQHTIPTAIPILELCEPHGSFVLLGDKEATWETEKVKQYLQEWTRKCYRACLCWHQRKQAWQSLQGYKKTTNSNSSSSIRVDSIETPTSEAYHQISFRLYQSGRYFETTLFYGDWVKVFPTTVKVVAKNATSSGHDTIEMCHAQRIEKAFLNHSIDRALDELSKRFDS